MGSEQQDEIRRSDRWLPRWLWRGVSRFAGLLLAMGRTLDEALQHAMEAAGEWAQADSLPRPRLLEALRDDSCVKAALADGAVRQSCRSRAANPVRGEYKLHA